MFWGGDLGGRLGPFVGSLGGELGVEFEGRFGWSLWGGGLEGVWGGSFRGEFGGGSLEFGSLGGSLAGSLEVVGGVG